ncbi:MAG TPA: TlpA disulfide reductase family protein [Bryobacteraceae bacterium]|nr:TlpA disulfide reductase family protein [Bryobacteraceae bacterium]
MRFAVCMFFALAVVSGEQGIRATIKAVPQRSAAPALSLKDASGKTVGLEQYRGKVVLLNFWATWCHGCVLEIPWFMEFDKTYRNQGLAVVGVSMDGDGWKAINPYVAKTRVLYRILLGNDGVAEKYGVRTMPDSYLIDRQGRLAAIYSGLVDRGNIEANIKTMLSEH